jgi:hypothetical protein
MREIGYVFKGFLCIGLMVDGKPRIVRRGMPLPQIPEAEWQRLSQKCPSTFTCSQCAKPVLGFKAPSTAAITQACRCTLVSHFSPAQPYSSGTDWSDFHAVRSWSSIAGNRLLWHSRALRRSKGRSPQGITRSAFWSLLSPLNESRSMTSPTVAWAVTGIGLSASYTGCAATSSSAY